MKRNARIFVALAALLFLSLILIWPERFSWPLTATLLEIGGFLKILPLIIYGLVSVLTWKYLMDVPRDSVQVDLDKTQASSLTLAGFCFTSMSLLISFFKDEIKRAESGPQDIIVFFAMALACFAASYLVLRYRQKNIFQFLSEAFIDNGFWCIFVGLWLFSERTAGLERLQSIFVILIGIYLFYLLYHLLLSYQFAKKS